MYACRRGKDAGEVKICEHVQSMNVQCNIAAASYVMLAILDTNDTASWFSEHPKHKHGVVYTKKTVLPCKQR